MKGFEWKWGGIISLAGFAWLVISWAVGWHESGIGLVQVSSALAVFVTFIGTAFSMRDLLRREPETSFAEGLRRGVVISVIAGVIAVLAQVVYFRFINPAWSEYMVEQVRLLYASQGLGETDLEEVMEGARTTFGLTSYAVQAGAGALILGGLSSAISLLVLKWLQNR